MKVRFTPTAREQFLAVITHIRDDNPRATRSFRKKAESALRRLGPFPKSGRTIPEFPGIPHREVIVSPYRFFYRVEGKTAWIVAVWHGSRLPKKPRAR